MPELTAKCKGTVKEGAEDKSCPEQVTYDDNQIIVAAVPQNNTSEFDVYLTCKRGHTCKYWVKSGSLS